MAQPSPNGLAVGAGASAVRLRWESSAMIRLEDVTLAPGGDELVEGATWHLRPGVRAGLVGRNGTGKTTLLRAIVGERPADGGRVTVRASARLGWLPQQAVSGSTRPVWEEAASGLDRLNALRDRLQAAEREVEAGVEGALERWERTSEAFRLAGGWAMDERVGEVLHGLGFGPESWRRTCDTFSGGWQMRIALARTLLSDPDVLILDEPTNHLDLHARAWLARHLASGPWTLLVTSHDRHLLDVVCTEIVEIRHRRLHTYAGNFTRYLAERELRENQQLTAFEAQQEEIARLERFVERFKAKATKATQAQSRQNRLDRLDRLEAPEHEKLPRFRLPPAPPADAEIVALERASLGWDRPLIQGVELTLERGMRLAILGPNGAGKSTLLQALTGRLPILSGKRRVGRGVRMGVFAQDLAAALPPEQTGLEHVLAQAPRAGEPKARAILGALGLPGDDALRPIGQLSGGEKARVALAGLGASEHNVLFLDEPTNHLDVVTVQVLADALEAFDGAIVLVSHDRWLVERLATHVARILDGKLDLHEGVRPEDLEPVAAARQGERDDGGGAGAQDHEERKRRQRERDRARKRQTELERSLEKIDAQIAEVDQRMFDEGGDFQRARVLQARRSELEAEQLAVLQAWEEQDRIASAP